MSRKNYKNYLFWQGLITLLLLLLIGGIVSQFLGNTSLAAAGQSATVIKVIDGDTIDVKMAQCRLPLNGNPQQCRIRLACIDAPERGQNPFYKEAKNRVKELLPPGKTLTLKPRETDVYSRLVAEVLINNQSVNLQLVREGKAVIFCRYLKNCPSSQNDFLSAEAAAIKAGLGVWNTQQPWTKMRENHPCRS
ncbi:MAG: thermonuclease family protein [Phormidium sp.]